MNEDKIITKLVEHDERLERLENKVDGMGFKVENMANVLDKAMVILQRLDQERIFTAEWIRRIENDVERVKKQLNIV